ncbi:MAG: YajQ family cyclic di-GMP-binding protein [Thermodesulfovibrionales bacterium]|jgi:cyclic-di-GMP-binding protein|nr:YajQ family cyclic di-GMP-binding protein [Thermodesulfovibrionales bacterium]
MADEHTFDIVSKVDLQEVSNAVQQAVKEISQRFDFKGSKSSIDLSKEKAEITLVADDDYKLKSLTEILKAKLVKRNVSLKTLNFGNVEKAAGDTLRQLVSLQQGLSPERAKDITKLIKETKLKVQTEIQKDQVRVRAKKIDDLQALIKMLKEKDFDFHIEFINYR